LADLTTEDKGFIVAALKTSLFTLCRSACSHFGLRTGAFLSLVLPPKRSTLGHEEEEEEEEEKEQEEED